jgi:transposase, IS30 family
MKYLTLKERKYIEKMLKEKESYRNIGLVLGRSHTTISDEVRKNKMSYEKEYNAEIAHARFLRRQENKGKKPILELYPDVKEKIIEWLTEEQWSPEQISGTLKLMYKEMKVVA